MRDCNDIMTVNDAEIYIYNWDEYTEFFGYDITAEALKTLTIGRVTSFKYVETGSHMDWHFKDKGYECLCERTFADFEEWRGEWMRKVRKLASQYRIPDQYKLWENKFLRHCLIMAFPYLENFSFECFHLYTSEKSNEIYIKAENGNSLYVPLKALKNRDFSLIEERMNSYWKWYYCKDTKRQKNQLETLETETAQKLKKDLISN